MRITLLALLGILAVPFFTSPALAHCQIPCGIYDDKRQFDELDEHIRTVEKSMMEIDRLSAASPADYHMVARWTANKEEHAQEIQDIAHAYFLTQRVKVPATQAGAEWSDYVEHTTLLHQILVAAMKCKQTTDLQHVEKLRDLVASYKAHYFKDHSHD
ncbi:superoxide dismutase [Ni] [Parvularcula sp. IMCC14364]|uniref:superoxide dismutase [Ni] n=1 Tax=Parvularcula sp. IMCC14364 TaxID=3067902 RepID=UPI0027417C9B|nr:superoxide dismutase [Ni] [Parvularcula sp. IMCC14364]